MSSRGRACVWQVGRGLMAVTTRRARLTSASTLLADKLSCPERASALMAAPHSRYAGIISVGFRRKSFAAIFANLSTGKNERPVAMAVNCLVKPCFLWRDISGSTSSSLVSCLLNGSETGAGKPALSVRLQVAAASLHRCFEVTPEDKLDRMLARTEFPLDARRRLCLSCVSASVARSARSPR